MRRMLYSRKFVLQSCHFNSQETYDKYEKALDPHWGFEHGSTEVQRVLCEVLADIHGHNFVVNVSAVRVISDSASDFVVVWDEELEKVVREWDRTNLSVHPDFVIRKMRATTENMCALLKTKLEDKFSVRFAVTIHETDEIYASVDNA